MVKLSWIIFLPKKLIGLTCRLVFRCKIFTYMMGCSYTAPDSPETRKLKEKLNRRNQLDEYLRDIGKTFFQSNAGGVGTAERFESTLYQIDQAHQDLINFAKQYLPENVITNILINEKLERKLITLESEIVKLRTEKRHQKQYYENIIAERAREYYEGETKVEQRYSGLATYCKSLEEEIKHFHAQTYTEPVNNVSIDDPYTRIQRQEETLKAQNDLINDLKRQLSNWHALQPVLQEFQNEIQRLKTTLNQRDQQLKQLHQEHQTLQKQMSSFEPTLKQEWHNLQELCRNQVVKINILQQTLDFTINERNELQREGAKQNLQIRSLNNEILQLRRAAEHHQTRTREQQGYKANFSFDENKGGQNNGEVQQNYKGTETKREFHEVKDNGSGNKGFTFGEKKEEVPESQSRGTGEQQGNQVNVENQQEAESEYVRESLKKVRTIFENAKTLERDVRAYSGTKEDATFLHLQELLIRGIVKLDSVQSDGNFVIRERRKEVIRYIQYLLNILKDKT